MQPRDFCCTSTRSAWASELARVRFFASLKFPIMRPQHSKSAPYSIESNYSKESGQNNSSCSASTRDQVCMFSPQLRLRARRNPATATLATQSKRSAGTATVPKEARHTRNGWKTEGALARAKNFLSFPRHRARTQRPRSSSRRARSIAPRNAPSGAASPCFQGQHAAPSLANLHALRCSFHARSSACPAPPRLSYCHRISSENKTCHAPLSPDNLTVATTCTNRCADRVTPVCRGARRTRARGVYDPPVLVTALAACGGTGVSPSLNAHAFRHPPHSHARL
jgi:hypothetical protein